MFFALISVVYIIGISNFTIYIIIKYLFYSFKFFLVFFFLLLGCNFVNSAFARYLKWVWADYKLIDTNTIQSRINVNKWTAIISIIMAINWLHLLICYKMVDRVIFQKNAISLHFESRYGYLREPYSMLKLNLRAQQFLLALIIWRRQQTLNISEKIFTARGRRSGNRWIQDGVRNSN